MEKLLLGHEGTVVFINDILIAGSTLQELKERTEKVLKTLEDAGFTVNLKKCEFFEEEIEILGYKLNKDGLHMLESKIKALIEAREPTNVQELSSFLGMISYYRKFIYQAATLLKPLYKLLEKNVPWCWSEECMAIYVKVKEILSSKPVLVQFNPSVPVKVTCDASPYGISSVLSHIL